MKWEEEREKRQDGMREKIGRKGGRYIRLKRIRREIGRERKSREEIRGKIKEGGERGELQGGEEGKRRAYENF